MRVTRKVVLEVSGDNLDDLVQTLTKIRTDVGPESATVEMDSYELTVEWSEDL